MYNNSNFIPENPSPMHPAQLLQTADKQGNAAVVLLSSENGHYVWQRKTPGYPVPGMVGSLCLFGGNKEAEDESARATLLRELREELPKEWYEEIAASLVPFARYVVFASKDIMSPKPMSYAFVACAFRATLAETTIKAGGEVLEGKFELLDMDTLAKEHYCWGYDVIFKQFVEGSTSECISFPTDYPRCVIQRVAPDADFGEWSGNEVWQ